MKWLTAAFDYSFGSVAIKYQIKNMNNMILSVMTSQQNIFEIVT